MGLSIHAVPPTLQVLALMLQLMGSRRAVSDRFYRWVWQSALRLANLWRTCASFDAVAKRVYPPQLHLVSTAADLCVCRALYAVLLSPDVSRANKAPMFVSLVFKARLCNALSSRCAVGMRSLPTPGPHKPLSISILRLQAMKVDVSIKRVAAFAKRLLQVALQSPAPFAAGILFLVSEVLKV